MKKKISDFIKKAVVLVLVMISVLTICAADGLMDNGYYWVLALGTLGPYAVGWVLNKMFNICSIFDEKNNVIPLI